MLLAWCLLADRLEVLHGGKRVVEVVEQPLPFPISGGTAETLGVVFERLPAHEEDVALRGLDAALQLVGEVARRGGYDGGGLGEGPLELVCPVWQDVQQGDLQDQDESPLSPWREL